MQNQHTIKKFREVNPNETEKMFAGVVAAAMMLTMSATAFADENVTYTDVGSVKIIKSYEATNTGTISPAETFKFTIERTSVADAGSEVTAQNMPLPTIGSVSYNAGEAGSGSKSKEITVTLPPYDSVGIYTYTIYESAGSTAGVTYRTADIRLVVTVLQGEDGMIRVAAVHTEDANGTKTNTFDDNEYSAGSLTVTKQVTGNMGDRQKEFNVTVTFAAPEGKTVREAIFYTDDTETKTIAANWTGTATAEIRLKHDESVTFTNIPYGVTYTVVEEDYTVSAGYDEAEYTFSDTNKKVDSDSDTVTITNNKGANTIDTGIGLDSLPYIMILAMVAVAMVVFLGRKRCARN